MTWVENLSRRDKQTQAQSFHLPFGKWMWRGNSRKPHSSPLDVQSCHKPRALQRRGRDTQIQSLTLPDSRTERGNAEGSLTESSNFTTWLKESHPVVFSLPLSTHSLAPPTKRPIFSPLIMIAPQQRIIVHTQWDLRRYHSESFIGLMKIEKNPKTGTNPNEIVS